MAASAPGETVAPAPPRDKLSRRQQATGIEGRSAASDPRMLDPGPPSCLIHRSAWKGNSAKYRCRILHSPGPIAGQRLVPNVGRHTRRLYILWRWIKMRKRECSKFSRKLQSATRGAHQSVQRFLVS
jgi:hypothetical protein